MSNLVNFDNRGALGPAIALIYNSSYYNTKGVSELSELLKTNFMHLTHVKPKGKKEFIAFVKEKNNASSAITAADIISTKFFQSMQKSEPSLFYHEKVLSFIVPRLMKTVQERYPEGNKETSEVQEVGNWLANLMESYMTEEQITQQCELQANISEKVAEERKNTGIELYALLKTDQLTEKDFDTLLKITEVAMNSLSKTDHFASTLKITARYLNLFSMNEKDPMELYQVVSGFLSTMFRDKAFPKKDEVPHAIQ